MFDQPDDLYILAAIELLQDKWLWCDAGYVYKIAFE